MATERTESQKSLSGVRGDLDKFCKMMNVDQLDGNKERISECITLLCEQVETTDRSIEETIFKATKLFLVSDDQLFTFSCCHVCYCLQILMEKHRPIYWPVDTIRKVVLTLGILIKSRRDETTLRKAYTNLVRVTKNIFQNTPNALDDFKPAMVFIFQSSLNALGDGHSICVQMKIVQLILAALPILGDETILRKNLQAAAGEKALDLVDELVKRFNAITDENFNQVSKILVEVIHFSENPKISSSRTDIPRTPQLL